MSTTAIATASNADESQMQSSPSFFSTLPNDIIFNIFARVPKRYHPILNCVSKSTQSLIHSSAFHETRSVLGNDSLYLCFRNHGENTITSRWFNLHRSENAKIQLTTISFSKQPILFSTAIAVHHHIYLFGLFNNQQQPSLSDEMWILDTRSGSLEEGPSMHTYRLFPIIGLINYDTIYVIGGCCRSKTVQAEMFNTKTQIWEIAPYPKANLRYIQPSGQNLTVNGEIYVDSEDSITIYDPKNGKCSNLGKPKGGNGILCVVDNVIYGYFLNFGLMWYDMKLKIWSSVQGLDRFDNRLRLSIGMTELSGKLAVIWEKSISCYGERKEIWCSLIKLVKIGIWIHGKFEESEVVKIVPRSYRLQYCVYFSD